MKYRCLLAAVAFCFFLPTTSRADSVDIPMDNCGGGGPSCDLFVLKTTFLGNTYTWSWGLPGSFDRDPDRNPPGSFGWFSIGVLTTGPLVGTPTDNGIGVVSGHDVFFFGTNSFGMDCNSVCNQWVRPIFTSAIWDGNLDHPTFLPGRYVGIDGRETTLTITRVPEGSKLAMIGIMLLGISGPMFFGRTGFITLRPRCKTIED